LFVSRPPIFYEPSTELTQHVSDEIDKTTYEIKQDPNIEDQPVSSIEELIEEIPDNTPRYIVLSYPLTLPDGRKKSPLVLIYWLPQTSQQSQRMLYAAAVQLFRDKAGVSKYVNQYFKLYISNTNTITIGFLSCLMKKTLRKLRSRCFNALKVERIT
jgi:hypothetical protein